MIAETLADLVTPQAEHIRDTLFQSGCDDPLTAYNDYLTTQKNLLVLTTASIMAGLGQDVDVAIQTADNALSHNFIQTALVAAAAGYTAYEAYDIYQTYEAEGAEAAAKKLGLVVVETAVAGAVGKVVFKVAGVVYPTAAAALSAYKAAHPGFNKAYNALANVAHKGRAAMEAVVQKLAGKAAVKADTKLFWGTWNDYPKKVLNDKQYAEIGNRLYSRHAIDRMQPSGLGAPLGAKESGRSFAPSFVEDVIQNGSKKIVTVNGVDRTIHTLGSAEVITEKNAKIIITVNPFRGGK